LFGLLGGLGSRARKGFGSIAIQQLNGIDGYSIPTNINEYKERLKNLCHSMPADLPPFTAFSQQSRIEVLQNQNQRAWQLLSNIGHEMKSYRSYQKDKLFPSDHDLARDVATGTPISEHPDRVVFGLPHNYFFTSIHPTRDAKVDVNPVHLKAGSTKWTSEGRGRRASPLFIHLHQFPNGHCVAIQALLPATFLPDSDRIEIKGSARHSATCQISPNIDWKIIHNYLNRFSSQRIYP
jgi:CRISPR-associated protein Cmr1